MTAASPIPLLPFSAAAEEVFAALEASVGNSPEDPLAWLSAVIDRHPEALSDPEGDPELDAVQAAVRTTGDGIGRSQSLTRSEIERHAGERAQSHGRSIVSSQDIIQAVLALVVKKLAATGVQEEVPEQASEPDPDPENAGELEFPEVELEISTDLPGAHGAGGVADASPEGLHTDPSRSRTFRLFVSSTFQDLQAERNALQKVTFPRLEKFCALHGARFQAIDLRWGVSEEAGIDQQTMNICLGEIERCQRVTPRPNFLILLGDRYGWLPPPPQIPAQEFEEILDQVGQTEEPEGLVRWYRKDLNADPPNYRLRPRAGEMGEYRDWQAWMPEETGLRETLGRAVGTGGLDLPAMRRKVYQASATEQEIIAGALGVAEPEEKVFCILRRIEGYPKDEGGSPLGPPNAEEKGKLPEWPDFFVSADESDRTKLQRLKLTLADRLPPSNQMTRKVPWADKGPDLTEEYLAEVAEWVAESLEQAILRELEDPTEDTQAGVQAPDALEADPILATEVREHLTFAEERRRFFVGREDLLMEVTNHVSSDSAKPLALVGDGGTGKSAVMAEAARRIEGTVSGEVLVVRFIGATPGSSDGRSLLESLCREIAMRYGSDPGEMPSEYQELVPKFAEQLGLASSDRPLVLLVDSLDQLTEPAIGLTWIPFSLPPHVRLVVSTRPEEVQERLKNRGPRFLELEPLSRDDGELLLQAWLSSARPPRRLQPIQREAVLDAFVASEGKPLYLKLAAEEARRWPAWADIRGEVPEDLPTPQLAKGVNGIIRDNLFQRLSHDDSHGSELASRAIGYLAASRFGLAEDELFQLLSRDPDIYSWFLQGAQHMPQDLVDRATSHWSEAPQATENRGAESQASTLTRLKGLCQDPDALRTFLSEEVGLQGLQLPVVLWSRLFFDLEPYLTERQAEGGTLLSFYHRELGDVGREEFLTADTREEMHGRLADYFRSKADPDGEGTWLGEGVRGLSELPYHLTHAGRWDEVYETLTDFSFLEQKAARVGIVERTLDGGKKDTLYTGVFQLQDDFDRALQEMPGNDEDKTNANPLIVTAVNFGKGLVVRCPWCNTQHPLNRGWLGEEIRCPNETCRGPLKVNTFTVGEDN